MADISCLADLLLNSVPDGYFRLRSSRILESEIDSARPSSTMCAREHKTMRILTALAALLIVGTADAGNIAPTDAMQRSLFAYPDLDGRPPTYDNCAACRPGGIPEPVRLPRPAGPGSEPRGSRFRAPSMTPPCCSPRRVYPARRSRVSRFSSRRRPSTATRVIPEA